MPISAALLTDPKSLKRHLTNGNSLDDFHFDSSRLPARQSSEPPTYSMNYSPPVPTSSMDDAYHISHDKGHGKNLAIPANLIQTRGPTFDPRQLLDPKRFNSSQRQNDTDDTMPKEAALSESKGLQNEIPVDKERGMGNLIEQVYNITPREDRPRKKQKTDHSENEVEEKNKAVFSGGGKGGDIGEYMKQKRKEGQEMSGSINAVVDLTGGRLYHSMTSTRTAD